VRALALWLALAFTGLAGAQTPAPIVSPAQWMRSLADDFLVPGYEALSARARELESATRTLCSAPGTSELAHARERWRAAALEWRRVAVVPIGPTLARRSARRLDFWPTRPGDVEAAIARTEAGATLERVGVSARGLPALEYLLFADVRLSRPAHAARCRYAAVLAAEVGVETAALATEWRKWGAQWPDAAGEDAAHAAMTDGLNALVGALEQLRLRRLQKPRASTTQAELLAGFEGVEQALAGANRVLRGLGHLELAERVEGLAREARASLQALPPALDAKSAAAARARAAGPLGRLQTALATDVADALRVTVGFNESDGD
jgi:uncharacterized protein